MQSGPLAVCFVDACCIAFGVQQKVGVLSRAIGAADHGRDVNYEVCMIFSGLVFEHIGDNAPRLGVVFGTPFPTSKMPPESRRKDGPRPFRRISSTGRKHEVFLRGPPQSVVGRADFWGDPPALLKSSCEVDDTKKSADGWDSLYSLGGGGYHRCTAVEETQTVSEC